MSKKELEEETVFMGEIYRAGYDSGYENALEKVAKIAQELHLSSVCQLSSWKNEDEEKKSLYFAYYQDHDGVQYWGHYITNSAEEAINELLKENGDIDIYYSKFVRAIDLSDKIKKLKEENDV